MKKRKLLHYLKHKAVRVYTIFRKKINGQNNIIIKDSVPARLKVEIRGNENNVNFKSNSFLDSIQIFIYGNNNKITVSESCTVKNAVFWIEDNNCEIFIGSQTTIESVDFGVSEDNSKVHIGEDYMLSSGIKFKTGDSHSIVNSDGIRINPAGNIKIGNHVWIGQEAVILKNTIIGDNSVIGLRSVITKEFHNSNVLLAGMPAKIIKEDINWTRERIKCEQN